jgi:hypothetical protein
MGKVKSSASSFLHMCISEFKDMSTSDDKVLFGQACGNCVVAQQHSSGSKHIATIVSLKDQPDRQYLIGESSVTSSS